MSPTFLTEEYHDSSGQEVESLQAVEAEGIQKGYQLAVLDFHRQISLRNREIPIVKNMETIPRPSSRKPKNNIPLEDASKNASERKDKRKKDKNVRQAEQAKTFLSIETEISKIKIAVPLTELLKNADYQSQIIKVLKPPHDKFAIANSLNIQDDVPTILFGPHVE